MHHSSLQHSKDIPRAFHADQFALLSRVRARTECKSRATAFKASSTGIFPSVVFGMMLRWHCETTQECERPIIRANSRIPAVFSDIRSSSKHKQKPSDKLLFSGQTTFSKPITRRPLGLARPAPCGFGFPVPRPPLAPCIIHPKRFRSNLRKSQEVGFSVRLARARARAEQCALSSTTAPPSRRANPLRHNARALRSNRQNLHELHAQNLS